MSAHRQLNMSAWAVSNTNLSDAIPSATGATGSRHRRLIRVAWQTLAAKCQQLTEFLKRETNKPLPKELRRSLRLNKSAKRKGYQHYETEADKQRIKDYLNQPINLSVRLGPAYDYRPSNS
ncbi:hypothetical protein AWZ03_001387 [Drosophila navojoa]|uniref:Uncharacterized protein n=1 Tax=Drosophila navojoa TaxID=7232 RepID=A0A484BTG8_DRONA|nr:uncharacterized protein LOC108659918 [Drosophila navojoa]TDG52106.1 hypothetical protein AWZ03_001387 [Drosophila navojoa]